MISEEVTDVLTGGPCSLPNDTKLAAESLRKTIDMISGTIHRKERQRKDRWFAETNVPQTTMLRRERSVTSNPCHKYILWIDGVGAWQVCVGDSFVVGAPSAESRSADIALLANVSRQHATIQRRDEEWRLYAHQPTSVTGRTIAESGVLRSGDQICLAERVKLGFRIPSALSSSAVIDFESDHRPSHSLDGIILLTDHCLLGPRSDHHICCREWPDQVILFCQDDVLKCRSKTALSIDGQTIADSAALKHGSVVTAEGVRFRVEEVD